MKRRKALKQIGSGLAAGLLAPQFFSSCKKEDHTPQINFKGKVAVIGAGAAGLYAADILHAQGLDVFVLEARNSLGGRIRSFSTSDSQTDNSSSSFFYDYHYPSIADFPIELGGDMIMGSNSAWGKIVSILNLPVVDVGTANHQYVLDNIPKSSADWQGDPDFTSVQTFVSGLSSYSGADESVKNAANVNPRAQALLNAQAGNFYGSAADRIGAIGLADELKLRQHDSKILTVKTNAWQDILLSRFNEVINKVQLNTPVTSIDYSGDLITITDKSGKQFTADKVIVAVPLSVLKNSRIVFAPSLPSTNTTAMAKFGMDACIRLVIDFKKNFWGETDGLIWGGTTAPQYFNAGFGRSQFSSTMFVTVCGQAAEQLSTQGPSMINPVLAEIDLLYNGQGTKWVRRKVVNDASGVPQETDPIAFIYDWSKDEYIKGGNSYSLVGATHQDRISLGTAVPGGKIFFAGEATDINGDAGTVSGALQSAERATHELIKSITA